VDRAPSEANITFAGRSPDAWNEDNAENRRSMVVLTPEDVFWAQSGAHVAYRDEDLQGAIRLNTSKCAL
jgi:hypothetical protein